MTCSYARAVVSQALVYTGEQTLEVRRMPMPVPSDDEVLVEVRAVGICGSDMHAYLGHDERRPPPLILGHEAAGIVVDSGRRVTVNPLVSCGACEFCERGHANLCPQRQIISMPPRQGAFAQWLAIPEKNLITVPDDIDFTTAALAEPLACGWHAVRRAAEASARPLSESQCIVLGGGAIGLGAALILSARNAASIAIVEPNPIRHDMLAAAGDFQILSAADESHNNTANIIIDAVGSRSSREAASRLVRAGGVIIHIGLASNDGGLDTRRFTLQEITFIGVYTYTEADFAETANAIFTHQLGNAQWWDTRPLQDGAAAFADLLAQKIAVAKLILIPPN